MSSLYQRPQPHFSSRTLINACLKDCPCTILGFSHISHVGRHQGLALLSCPGFLNSKNTQLESQMCYPGMWQSKVSLLQRTGCPHHTPSQQSGWSMGQKLRDHFLNKAYTALTFLSSKYWFIARSIAKCLQKTIIFFPTKGKQSVNFLDPYISWNILLQPSTINEKLARFKIHGLKQFSCKTYRCYPTTFWHFMLKSRSLKPTWFFLFLVVKLSFVGGFIVCLFFFYLDICRILKMSF